MSASPETIVALATPPGSGARAIVRLSGPQAWTIAEARIVGAEGACSLAHTPSHRLVDAVWLARDSRVGELRVPVRLYLMRAPRTYTREDVVEIHLPGGSALSGLVLADCLAAGARLARPGEFTLRAFLNGRIDLAQAESVEILIGARSDAERRAALRHLDGDISRDIHAWRAGLVELAAMIEGSLDFEADEFEPFPAETVEAVLARIRRELDALRSSAGNVPPPRGAIPVFFAGLTNAGKSALVNALLGHEATVVSPERSTTRDVLEFDWDIPPFRFVLQDAPGHDADPGDMARHASSLAGRAGRLAGILLFVVDSHEAPPPELFGLAASLPPVPVIPVLTKGDLVPHPEAAAFAQHLAGQGTLVYVSAVSGTGLDSLRAALLDVAVGDVEHAGAEGALTLRVSDELARASGALERAAFLAGSGMHELLAEELRAALAALALCVGEGYAEDVLESIFSRFCIGK